MIFLTPADKKEGKAKATVLSLIWCIVVRMRHWLDNCICRFAMCLAALGRSLGTRAYYETNVWECISYYSSVIYFIEFIFVIYIVGRRSKRWSSALPAMLCIITRLPDWWHQCSLMKLLSLWQNLQVNYTNIFFFFVFVNFSKPTLIVFHNKNQGD